MRHLASLVVLIAMGSPASAGVLILIDRTSQTMRVKVDGVRRYNWPVSTGVPGHGTPAGFFVPTELERDYYSRKYNNAPMPHSIFFTRWRHAIHGTEDVRRLGSPASRGCVRLAPRHAATLYALVGARRSATKIRIVGSIAGLSKPKKRRA